MIDSNLKSYPNYKPSGIEWLGDVPKHWKIRRIKSLSLVKRGASPRPIGDAKYFKNDGEFSWVRIADVTASDRYLEKTTQRLSPLGQSLSIELQPGSLFLSIAGSVGKPIISKIKCCIHDGFVYFPQFKGNVEFLYRVFSCRAPFGRLGKFGTQLNLNTDTVGGIHLGWPSRYEQHAIVRFLDHADRRIRRYIRAKERLIELLEEQKQAIIHQAVTGQIDVRTGKPYPAYKDSGIEWLGEVPEHWKKQKLGQLGRFSKGSGGTKGDEYQDGVPCVRYGDLYTQHRFFIVESRGRIRIDVAKSTYTPIQYGDVLFAGSGETLDEIGKSAVNLMSEPAYCGGDVIIFRPSIPIDPKFLGYAIDCPLAVYQKACFGRGITVMHIYASELKYLTFFLPTLSEQMAIAFFLDQTIATIDLLVARSSEEIELRKEYLTRLIADVVTGKIDVRKAAAQLTSPTSFPLDGIEGIPRENDDAKRATPPKRGSHNSAKTKR